jgi:hypothetical protein
MLDDTQKSFLQFHMNKKLARVCSLLAVCLGLFAALPTKAASLQLAPYGGASGVPTNLTKYVYHAKHSFPRRLYLRHGARMVSLAPKLQPIRVITVSKPVRISFNPQYL